MSDALKNPDLRKVSNISGHFFVPSYQRGYRWGRHEVEALLNDIYAEGKRPEGEKYCLQPLVVKQNTSKDSGKEGLPPEGEVYYELIDGQQRLTTLYLIYLFLKEIKGITPSFTLAYETRPGSTGYLQNPDPSKKEDNIDFYFMYDAYQCVREWFKKTAESSVDGEMMGVADDIYRYLRNQIYVIWYDAGKEDSITLFTRLNVGRIALTNAELVRALLLKSNGRDPSDNFRQIEISTQWDMIERDLQNSEFWAFLTNNPAAEYPTRIELLFDLLAKKAEGEKDRYFTFLYFREDLSRQEREDALPHEGADAKTGALAVWAPVLELYYLLREWFECRDRYHKIGYLITAGEELSSLVADASGENPLSKSDFLALLDNRISDQLDLNHKTARNLNYRNNYDKCEQLLLLFNVESMRILKNSSERYPFNTHKRESWSLEHIHAQNAEPLKTEEGWRIWLSDARNALEKLPRFDVESKETGKTALIQEIATTLDRDRVERKDFTPLSQRILSEYLNTGCPDSEEHSIANLALLSGKVNSALNNGAFQVKRLKVNELDRAGDFIPICTRRVFLKYYTEENSQQMHLWGRDDRTSYLGAMLGPPVGAEGQSAGVVGKYLKPVPTEN